MNEIKKLYENANIEPIDFKYEPMGNMVFTADCIGNTWTREQYMKEVPVYPEFSAEKQLKLIKFLLEKYCDIRIRKNLEGAYYITSFNDISCFSEDFEETLASFMNTHLQDLTEQEKAEIRNILNES